MTPPHLQPEPVAWEGDRPRSERFDDPYFSRAGGLAEARAVFLAGCGLPEAWARRSEFVVGELGFGAGLNVAALLDLWRRTRPKAGRLHIFSVEAHPLAAADAARALTAFPELAAPAAALVQRWPPAARGFHRLELCGFDAVVDVALLDVEDALAAWTGAADAWFLDGFAPARNPSMWSERVLGAVARRSAPGARLATYTVAGTVRRNLAAAGFAVAKHPGFGGKRDRLEAKLPGRPARRTKRPSAAIVGAGVAGAALARALVELGVRPLVIESEGPGAGASGNPAALVMPRLDAGGGPIGALYAQALERASDLYAAIPEALIVRGVTQLEVGPKDHDRHDRIAASDLFAAGAVERMRCESVSAMLGEPVQAGGLFFRDALVVEPAAVLTRWLAPAERAAARVAAIEPRAAGWSLLDAAGDGIAEAQLVFVCAGLETARLVSDAPLAALRGQVTTAPVRARPAWIGEAYAIPTRTGLLIGATHDRDDAGGDVRALDHARNLERLAGRAPRLAAQLADRPIGGRAGVRAVTPDFMPIAGEARAGGLFVLSGLGSRGFCSAPLLAEHTAAMALGAPSPLPAPLAALVDPRRFAMRRERHLARSGRVQAGSF